MDSIITDLKILKFDKSKYLKPTRISFKQNGVPKIWDCIRTLPSVSILLYHSQKDAFLFVKQFRPAVWYSQNNGSCPINSKELGYTYELCAGLMDKDISEEETIVEECIEEVGYKPTKVELVTRSVGGFGFSGNGQSMFYAQIDDTMKVNNGGGIDDEYIELIYIPRKNAKEFMFDESKIKGFGLMFALLWWQNEFNLSLE